MKVRSCFSVALGLVSVAVAEPHPTRPKEVTAVRHLFSHASEKERELIGRFIDC
jgi:hypothetical protein